MTSLSAIERNIVELEKAPKTRAALETLERNVREFEIEVQARRKEYTNETELPALEDRHEKFKIRSSKLRRLSFHKTFLT